VVWAQNYEPIEIIVVDDGSTDRGLEIVRGLGDREITVLVVKGARSRSHECGDATGEALHRLSD
jgi:glycosyltransferase involved in cell wall biosynthesis